MKSTTFLRLCRRHVKLRGKLPAYWCLQALDQLAGR